MDIKNLELETKQNIRNFETFKTPDNKRIIKNTLLRSNNLYDFTNKDIKILKEKYKVKTIIDLRNKSEINYQPYKIKGIKYKNIPLLANNRGEIIKKAISNSHRLTKIPNIYQIYMEMITSKYSKKMLKRILKICMNKKNYSILIHCTYGKDRTGVVILLLLSMLGFDEKDIIEDYLYTNKLSIKRATDKYNMYLEKTKDKEFSNQMKDIYLAKEEYIKYIIDYIKDEYKTINNYINKELKIDNKKIQKFKDEVLIKTKK